MLAIEYIKICGVFLSFYLVISYRKQHLSAWITIRRYDINYGDLMLGYFISTLTCSLVYWPNVSTYAAWFYYGATIACISIYKMLFDKPLKNRYIKLLDLLILGEFFVIVSDDLYWGWQPKLITIGLTASIISSMIIAGGKAISNS